MPLGASVAMEKESTNKVGDLTVTLLIITPSPNSAAVVPCLKLEPTAVMLTSYILPCKPDFGETVIICCDRTNCGKKNNSIPRNKAG